MSHIRFGVTLLAGTALALVALGPASARAQLESKYGGTLTVGLSGGDPDSLDPTVSRTNSAVLIYRTMCLSLYETNSKAQRMPLLAASQPVLSKDKLSYTIQLRKGIEFNDGTPFNAQAVVTTYQRFLTYPGSSRASNFASVDSLTATGPYTLVYHLKARDSTFTGDMYVLSPTQLAKLGAGFATDPVCVGPFMFDHRVVGDNVTVIKSPYYYDQKRVYLDKIVFKPTNDATTAAAALKAGDIQVLANIATTELEGVQQTSNLRVLRGNTLGWQGVFINLGNRSGVGNLPYANVGAPLAASAKLRQAFEEAIDRNTLNKVVFGGLVQAGCTLVAPANTAWYDATNVPCTPYDPKHAKKLVAESGFSNPTVRLLTPNLTERLRLAQFIQAQEAAVGINVVIDSTDNATSLSRAVSGNYDAYLSGSCCAIDPNTLLYQVFQTSGARNYSGYSSPRLDLILDNGLKATSIKARSTLYHVAQQILQNDRPLVVLYNPTAFIGVSTNVIGVQMSPFGDLTGAAFAQYK